MYPPGVSAIAAVSVECKNDSKTVSARPPEASLVGSARHTHFFCEMVYSLSMSRTNIDIDEVLIRKARKLTRLKTKRQIVDRALELLVRSESRKGILRFYGSGIWKGDLKASRRNRV
jgi:Arc/MetJ family transcription regulator